MVLTDHCKILLASGSPRRKSLLRDAGFNVRIISLDFDEHYPDSLIPTEVAAFLAEQKSLCARTFLQEDEILITADTIVVFENKILNKPTDNDEAHRMLTQLSGRKHHVMSGVSIYSEKSHHNWTVHSEVVFYPISTEEISYYLEHYRPLDKAGSYGIQDWIGWCKVKKIVGSYTNIMGLPLAQIYRRLPEHL